LSLVGTNVTGLGVGFVAFLQTGSLVWLAALFLAARLPGLLVSARAGDLVDRARHKAVLLGADAVAGVATLVALGLHFAGTLELWHLVVLAVIGSLANAYQQPAYEAAVPLLVEPDALPRAQGFLQMAQAAGILAGPAVAGLVVAVGGIGGILVVDALTFAVAIAATINVTIPRSDESAGSEPSSPERTRGSSLLATWRHLTGRRAGIRRLLIWGASINFVVTTVNLLLPALLLTRTGESTTGLILSIGGVAMLVSSVAVAGRGLPDRRVTTVTTATLMVGAGIFLIGLRPELPMIAAGVLITLAAVPVLGAAVGTIHQTEVEPAWQGRLSALRRVVSESLILPAAIVIPPVVDWVAEPAMGADGWGAELLGPVFGIGAGRGIGVTIAAAGLAVVGLALGMRRDRRLAELDRAATT
jgi:hypothetical protein